MAACQAAAACSLPLSASPVLLVSVPFSARGAAREAAQRAPQRLQKQVCASSEDIWFLVLLCQTAVLEVGIVLYRLGVFHFKGCYFLSHL